MVIEKKRKKMWMNVKNIQNKKDAFYKEKSGEILPGAHLGGEA